MKQRNMYLDVIKGIAIFLMVFAHCIQYGNGASIANSGDFFYDKVFGFVYSFHMPLLMLISGYLFLHTVEKYKSNVDFLKNRFMKLLLPLISWAILKWMYCSSANIIRGKEIIRISSIWSNFINDFWFVWAVFYCSVVVFLVKKYFRDSILIYIGGFILSLLLPGIIPNLFLYQFMYPFFVAGYLFAKNKGRIMALLQGNRLVYLFIIIFLLQLFLFSFWRYDSYIYISGYMVPRNHDWYYHLKIDLYRMLIGFIGSSMIIVGVKLLYNYGKKITFRENIIHFIQVIEKIIGKLGKESLGIYLLQPSLLLLLADIANGTENFHYFRNVIQAVILIGISFFICAVIHKIPVLNKFLLGGR